MSLYGYCCTLGCVFLQWENWIKIKIMRSNLLLTTRKQFTSIKWRKLQKLLTQHLTWHDAIQIKSLYAQASQTFSHKSSQISFLLFLATLSKASSFIKILFHSISLLVLRNKKILLGTSSGVASTCSESFERSRTSLSDKTIK